ncbi:Sec-independent protein translocase subunit TatA/TatB [Haloarcula halophila]|uniref:Sec-independent protein translocase subunit TatA/TatB n=1 Tax=Haloarcula TaxID=2237 RepID=UPI0023E435C1|nr:twin-arginine translocase TatA/TatE family subunit [Halomicroarcula sp. DFY41]
MTASLVIGMPGGTELLAILAIAILLFGANKLPGLARSSGQAIGEFKKGRDQIEREIRETVQESSEIAEERTGDE